MYIDNYNISEVNYRYIMAHGREISLTNEAVVMAIINVTPDSFSDGGKYSSLDSAYEYSMLAIEQGASILDIGGESTRPDAIPISEEEELSRVLPLIERLAKSSDIIISIDTYHASTARRAIEAGAHIVNSVKGLTTELAEVIVDTSAAAILMHNSWHEQDYNEDILPRLHSFFSNTIQRAKDFGISLESIALDPGFGFGKNTEENFSILRNFSQLCEYKLPLLGGLSRKRFLGSCIEDEDDPSARDNLTATASLLLSLSGANILRVHNVKQTVESLSFLRAIKRV